jgi:iron complex transport system substrate-binding protein
VVVIAVLCLEAAISYLSRPEEEARGTLDDFGRWVEIPENPDRIVSISPSTTEVIFALGLGDKVVGVSEYCDYPPEAEEKEKVSDYSHINVEKITALKPDIIFMSGIGGEGPVDLLESTGLRVCAFREARSIREIYGHIRLIGEILGVEDEAQEMIDEMKKGIEKIGERAKGSTRTAVVIWYQTDPTQLWVVGGNTYQNDMVELAGGENVFSDVDGYRSYSSVEELLARDPDVIVVYGGHGHSSRPADAITSDSALRGVKAIKNGRVFSVDEDLLARDGPRITRGIEELYNCIYGPGKEVGQAKPIPILGTAATSSAALLIVAIVILRRRS